jgi:hypothetical protein
MGEYPKSNVMLQVIQTLRYVTAYTLQSGVRLQNTAQFLYSHVQAVGS